MTSSFCRVLCFVVLFTSGHAALAQDIQVRGRFLADSIRVGDEVFFAVSAHYPKETPILFPDSSFHYGPFEFRRKRFFITETNNGISKDSAVYHLTTFETDPLQRLRVPVYRINTLDCTRIYTQWDTIKLRLSVPSAPENLSGDLPVRATLGYQNVPVSFNPGAVVIITGMSLLFASVIWIVFGERIRRRSRIKQMRRIHHQFTREYEEKLRTISVLFSRDHTEHAVVLWKRYMEQMNQRPYTKLTTKETLRIEKDPALGKLLKKVDAAIYGYDTDVLPSLEQLKTYADHRFNERLKEVNDAE
jgi:hypothetical protein